MRRVGLAIALLGLFTSSAAVAQRAFSVGGEVFQEADILDARALPELDGTPIIMLTFAAEASERFRQMTKRIIGKEMPIVIDGKTIAAPIVREEVISSVVEIYGVPTLEDATRVAKLISGKDPLPDSLEDE
jgi:preprotein translocase subunit SecD